MIDAGALPMPSRIELDDGTSIENTAAFARGSLLYVREPDPQVRPVVFFLIYERVTGRVADALRQHFDQHAFTDFDWTPPGATHAIRVMHAEPPEIAWETTQSANARVPLEQVLAHDSWLPQRRDSVLALAWD